MSLLGFRLPVPDFSTLSRRGKALGFDHATREFDHAACKDDGPRSLIIDSTDLKMHRGSGCTLHDTVHFGVVATGEKDSCDGLDPDKGTVH
jgi:hypothetical protein